MSSTRIDKIRAILSRSVGSLARGAGRVPVVDALEPRQLFAVNILTPVADVNVAKDSAVTVVALAGRYDNPELNGTITRFDTSLGAFNVELYNTTTPLTVNNFVRYITEGRYTNTIIHRNATNFVVQGGGFQRPSQDNTRPASIATFDPVQNEPGISNVRGTIAMAKTANNPNSATSQWFFNLGDNSANLNNQNGGFTVFGRVIGDGMNVVDAIAGTRTFDADSFYSTSGLFNSLPLRNFTQAPVTPDNFINVTVGTVPELSYSVVSSNPGLVGAALDGTNLNLTYGAGQTGSATVTVRVTAADGSFVEDAFGVAVVGPPTVGTIVAAPQPAVVSGQMMTLTAGNLSDPLKTLAKVQFFRDANDNGTLEPAEDTLLGEDANKSGGYSLQVSSAGFAEGNNTFFARALDANGLSGAAASLVYRVVPPPSVGTLTSSANPIPRLSTFDLRAGDLVFPGAAFKAAEFYRDTDGNGALDTRIDKKIASVSKLTGGAAIGKVSSKGFAFGENTFLARVQDRSGAWGATKSAVISVTNNLPTVAALKVTPVIVKNSGDVIQMSVAGTKDLDGRVLRTQYFRDAAVSETQGPNGVLDEGDALIGDVTTAGFKLAYPTTNLTGGQRFFARVFDNDGGVSGVVTATAYINLAPTIQSFTMSPGTGSAIDNFTASITAGDPDGSIKEVEVILDSNHNGVLDARGDKSLGKAKLIGGVWTLILKGKSLAVGENTLFARAKDNALGLSASSSAVVTIA